MPQDFNLGIFATMGYQINNIMLLSRDFLEQDLMEILGDKSFILAPFDDENCLQKIKSVISYSISPEKYQRYEFGYFAENQDKFCYIINKNLGDIENAIYRAKNTQFASNSRHYKLFCDNLSEIVGKVKGIANVFGINFAYYYDCGDILLHFDSNSNENLLQAEQVLYQTFGENIYIDKNISLASALQEILTVQNKRLLILDYANYDFLQDGLRECVKCGLVQFLIKKEFKNLDKARQYILGKKFDVLLVISAVGDMTNLAFINENESKNVQISYKNLQKYGEKGLFYNFLYTIIKKFKKNTWNF